MWALPSLLHHLSSDPNSWEVERGLVRKMRSSARSLLWLHFWQYIQEQFIREVLSWLFFSTGARQVYPFFHFEMLCFVACHLTVHRICTWHDWNANTQWRNLSYWPEHAKSTDNLTVFTSHASFSPYRSLNIFTLMLHFSRLPLWLPLSCFIHLVSWCFFQSSFKIHFSEQSFLSFPTYLLILITVI